MDTQGKHKLIAVVLSVVLFLGSVGAISLNNRHKEQSNAAPATDQAAVNNTDNGSSSNPGQPAALDGAHQGLSLIAQNANSSTIAETESSATTALETQEVQSSYGSQR